jgi:hypothetical protein
MVISDTTPQPSPVIMRFTTRESWSSSHIRNSEAGTFAAVGESCLTAADEPEQLGAPESALPVGHGSRLSLDGLLWFVASRSAVARSLGGFPRGRAGPSAGAVAPPRFSAMPRGYFPTLVTLTQAMSYCDSACSLFACSEDGPVPAYRSPA